MSIGVYGQLASVESRLGAQVVDGLVTLSVFFVAVPAVALSESLSLLGPILAILYYLLSDALPGGQSLGKRLLKIAVVEETSGLPCTLAQSAMRNATQVLGFLDWLWIFGEQRKRAGDFLAHTRVIRAKPLGGKKTNIERRAFGSIELHLSDDPEQFTFFAEAIQKKLAGRWTKQAHGLDQSYWELDVQGKKITVHREHYIGVVVYCDDDAQGRLLLERLQQEFEAGR